MKKFFFCISLVIHSIQTVQAEAQSRILVKARNASSIGFEAYLYSQDNLSTHSRWSLERYIDPEIIKTLQDEIEEILRGEKALPTQTRINTYNDLLSKAQSYNWPVKIRKLISRVWLFAYQLEPSLPEKRNLIKHLALFFPDFKPSDKEFLPQSIKDWNEELGSKPFLGWQPDSKWDDFRYLVINGQVYDLSERATISIPDRSVRITGFSDTFILFDRILEGRDLFHFSPPKEYLVSGDCEAPIYHPRTDRSLFKIYFNDQCVKQEGPQSADAGTGTGTDAGTGSSARSNNLNSPAWPASLTDDFSMSKGGSELKIPKWGWFVIGTIAIGLLIHSQERESSTTHQGDASKKTEPVVHQGF